VNATASNVYEPLLCRHVGLTVQHERYLASRLCSWHLKTAMHFFAPGLYHCGYVHAENCFSTVSSKEIWKLCNSSVFIAQSESWLPLARVDGMSSKLINTLSLPFCCMQPHTEYWWYVLYYILLSVII